MSGFDSDIVSLVHAASLITKIVLVILVGFSVMSWAVIIYKWWQFRLANRENRKFIAIFSLADGQTIQQAAERHGQSPMASVWLDVQSRDRSTDGQQRDERSPLESRFRRASDVELSRYEEYLPFLATTGNVSPFIGLFGTVLGIIDAFQSISKMGTASIAAVAPGIAEALVATAAGLFAAIPAVMAYNYFLNRLRLLATQLELFSADAVDRLLRAPRPNVSSKG